MALALTAGALLDVVTSGGLAAATVGGLAQPVRWTQLAFLTPYLLKSWLFWPLAILSVAGLATARSLSDWPRLAFLYAAWALALAFATLGKVGSSTNYFLEPILALCWTVSVGFVRLARTAPRLATAALSCSRPSFPPALRARARGCTGRTGASGTRRSSCNLSRPLTKPCRLTRAHRPDPPTPLHGDVHGRGGGDQPISQLAD